MAIGGFPEVLGSGRDNISHVFPDKVRAINQIRLGTAQILRPGIVVVLQCRGVVLDVFLVTDGLFNVLDGLPDDLFIITLGGQQACEFDHCVARIAFGEGGLFEAGFLSSLGHILDFLDCGLERRIQIALHQF